MSVHLASLRPDRRTVGSPMTWAEDRATVGTDPSADPGAKTEGRAGNRFACSARSSHPLRDWHQRGKSLAAQPREMNLATPEKVARISGKMWPYFPEPAKVTVWESQNNATDPLLVQIQTHSE